MFKNGIIFLICLNLINDVLSQETVEKQYPHWLLQLGIQEIPSKKLGDDDTPTKGCEVAMSNSVQIATGKQLENADSRVLGKSGLPLVKLGDRHYYFGTYFKANFFKAMQFCRDHGMALLSIETNEENTRIIDYIGTNVKNIDNFWTSGSDLGEEGRFVWLSTGKPLSFTYWSPPQPDNAGNIENCLEIWKLGDKHYIWNDRPCTNTFDFICEVPECTDFCIN